MGDEHLPPKNFLEKIFLLTSDKLRDFLPVYLGVFGIIAYRLAKTFLYFLLRKANPIIVDAGDWYGNDTLWRGILDINRILLYSDKNGILRSEQQRRYFSVIDGIVAGEGEGPLNAMPKQCGVILAGFNPVLLDYVCTSLMGFDPNMFPVIKNALKDSALNNSDLEIEIMSNNPEWKKISYTPTKFA